MRAIHPTRGALFAACLSAITATSLLAQAGPSCPNKTSCAETGSFVANVTDFRTSVSGRYRIVATTIRITNKLNHPLILGYVPGSGITTDDRGNRYSIGGASNVRGIGLISSGALDVKFILQPGESSDARFEFGWQPGHEIYGTAYEVELAIREIDPVSEHQYTLGKEHALRFSGFGSAPSVAAGTPAPVTSSAAGAVAAAAVAPIIDACAGRSKCYSSGPFVAEVSHFTGASSGRNHVLRMTLKFRNVTAQPIILAYHAGSNSITDNIGQRYYWGRAGTHDLSASGIGIVESNKADPQFILQPGDSREASFQLVRFNVGNSQIGTGYTYDVVIDQLEPLPGGQIRSLRSYSIEFPDLPLTGSGVNANSTVQTNALVEAIKKKINGKPR